MILKTITVIGLFGKPTTRKYTFNDDLSIITGRNGSGKTTIIKLAWFIISGNILLALKEVDFRICTIETSEYKCSVIRTGSITCRIELTINEDTEVFEDDQDDEDMNPFTQAAEDKANPIIISHGKSIFFPTFRRIEGGFSMKSGITSRSRPVTRGESEIDDTLSSLSRKLSNQDHIFVSAISTQDIVSLLLKRYASFSEEINAYQANVTRTVIDRIKAYERTTNNKQNADSLLSETRLEIEKIETFREITMQPLDAVRSLVEKLFQHSGISFGRRLSFGDAAEAVNSDALSAGEKQMLSFICYNAFFKDAVIFIDEPELSLHVDWQRQLYPILDSQNSGNQFIFSTHSPFIYGKYPDKEVALSVDRGE